MNNLDVFPRRNLPDAAEPWGRDHDKRVYDLESEVSSLRAALQGQNRNSASSIQTLANQVNDLTGRESYSAFDAALTLRINASSVGAESAWGRPVSFTLSTPRVVSLQFIAGTFFQASPNPPASGVSYIRGALYINGIRYSGASRTESGMGGTSTLSLGGYGTLMCRAVLVLPAGTHTVTGGYSDTNVLGAGSFMELASPSVFADILQPA